MEVLVEINKKNFEKKRYVFEFIQQFVSEKNFNFSFIYTKKDHYKFSFDGNYFLLEDYYLMDLNNYDDKLKLFPNEILDQEFQVLISDKVKTNDVIGTIFWFLTRYEERLISQRDQHERFLCKYSNLTTDDYKKPIVDKNIHSLINLFINQLKIPLNYNYTFDLLVTHDIDHPQITKNRNSFQIVKSLLGDIFKRNSFELFFKRFLSWSSFRLLVKDPADNLDAILKINNQYGVKSIFFFMAPKIKSSIDTLCDISDKSTQKQLNTVLSSTNSLLGIHPSYYSYKNKIMINEEIDNLSHAVNKKVVYSRMHYLKFDFHETFKLLEENGIKDDYTTGFPDVSGFKCGTSRRFRPFNFENNCSYDMYTNPLIMMDTTVLKYEKLSNNKIIKEHCQLATEIAKYGGNFIFLWHNTELMNKNRLKLYTDILSELSSFKN